MATTRLCDVEGCQSKHFAHGLCRTCYNASPEGKTSHARYNASPARKASHARYNATPARKASNARTKAARKAATPADRATCTVGSCDRVRQCHGLCQAHYQRLRHTGSTSASTPIRLPQGPSKAALEARHHILVQAVVEAVKQVMAWDVHRFMARRYDDQRTGAGFASDVEMTQALVAYIDRLYPDSRANADV